MAVLRALSLSRWLYSEAEEFKLNSKIRQTGTESAGTTSHFTFTSYLLANRSFLFCSFPRVTMLIFVRNESFSFSSEKRSWQKLWKTALNSTLKNKQTGHLKKHIRLSQVFRKYVIRLIFSAKDKEVRSLWKLLLCRLNPVATAAKVLGIRYLRLWWCISSCTHVKINISLRNTRSDRKWISVCCYISSGLSTGQSHNLMNLC